LSKKVGILFQPKRQAAKDMAEQLADVVRGLASEVWVCSSWEEGRANELAGGTELIVCLGGDGTILRAARIAGPRSIPIAAVNLGRVGFMTEVPAEDAVTQVPAFVRGDGRVEERAMLQAELASGVAPPFHALNDVFVGRGGRCRLVRVKATIDGEFLTTYKCDGVVLATATGSTGYSLAAGGPILHPLSGDILMQPLAAHLSSGTPLVLPPDTEVELEVSTTHEAVLSVDGQIEVPLDSGDIVRVKRSPYVTRLLRSQRPATFYAGLMQKLGTRE
jgi:NAD+ kinase